MAIKIGHARIDERGKGQGGAAGDQTKQEVRTQSWYNEAENPWHTVLRPKKASVAEKSAKACEAACSNDKVGYDQGGRNTLYKQAKAVDFDLAKITTACECDCSSLMHVCAIAGGANLEYGANGLTTRNMAEAFVASGAYERLTDSKYLTSDKCLRRGDILMKTGHTVMVLEDGVDAYPKEENTVMINLPVLQKGDTGTQVEALQRLLSTYGYNLGSKSPFDGKFGSMTKDAVIAFQHDHGLYEDGIVGPKTWAKLLGTAA